MTSSISRGTHSSRASVDGRRDRRVHALTRRARGHRPERALIEVEITGHHPLAREMLGDPGTARLGLNRRRDGTLSHVVEVAADPAAHAVSYDLRDRPARSISWPSTPGATCACQ